MGSTLGFVVDELVGSRTWSSEAGPAHDVPGIDGDTSSAGSSRLCRRRGVDKGSVSGAEEEPEGPASRACPSPPGHRHAARAGAVPARGAGLASATRVRHDIRPARDHPNQHDHECRARRRSYRGDKRARRGARYRPAVRCALPTSGADSRGLVVNATASRSACWSSRARGLRRRRRVERPRRCSAVDRAYSTHRAAAPGSAGDHARVDGCGLQRPRRQMNTRQPRRASQLAAPVGARLAPDILASRRFQRSSSNVPRCAVIRGSSAARRDPRWSICASARHAGDTASAPQVHHRALEGASRMVVDASASAARGARRRQPAPMMERAGKLPAGAPRPRIWHPGHRASHYEEQITWPAVVAVRGGRDLAELSRPGEAVAGAQGRLEAAAPGPASGAGRFGARLPARTSRSAPRRSRRCGAGAVRAAARRAGRGGAPERKFAIDAWPDRREARRSAARGVDVPTRTGAAAARPWRVGAEGGDDRAPPRVWARADSSRGRGARAMVAGPAAARRAVAAARRSILRPARWSGGARRRRAGCRTLAASTAGAG